MKEIYYKEESYKIIGACMEVHNELGSGFNELVYQEAAAIEFKSRNIPFEREKELKISYKDEKLIKKFKIDFLCYDKIILEFKAISDLNENHFTQVIGYLKASGIKLGLLINFGDESLQYRRIVY
jgi:GxxExxY protein